MTAYLAVGFLVHLILGLGAHTDASEEIGRAHANVSQHKSNVVRNDPVDHATGGGLVKSQDHSLLNASEKLDGDNEFHVKTKCSKLILSGTYTHQGIEGTYSHTSSGCPLGHHIYSGPNDAYLYHERWSSGESGWSIGPTLCSDWVYLYYIDDARYPEYITAVANEATSDDFISNPDIYLECSGCSTLALYGTEEHKSIEGTYTYLTKGCTYNHNVYQGPNGAFMYHMELSGEPRWYVSSTICSTTVYLAANDAATFPEDITEIWREADEDGFFDAHSIGVTCSAPTTTTSTTTTTATTSTTTSTTTTTTRPPVFGGSNVATMPSHMLLLGLFILKIPF